MMLKPWRFLTAIVLLGALLTAHVTKAQPLPNDQTPTADLSAPIEVPSGFEVELIASGLSPIATGGYYYPDSLQDLEYGQGAFGDYLYFIDTGVIYRVAVPGATPQAFASVPKALFMRFGYGGDLFVGTATGQVIRVLPDGTASIFAQVGSSIEGMAFDTSSEYGSRLYVSEWIDGGYGRVSWIDSSGSASIFAAQGTVGRETNGLEFCGSPLRLCVADQSGTIFELANTGSASLLGGIDLDPQIQQGESIVCGLSQTGFGNYLYVAEQGDQPAGRILRVSLNGAVEVFASGFQGFDWWGVTGLKFSPDGRILYVTDDVGRCIYAIRDRQSLSISGRVTDGATGLGIGGATVRARGPVEAVATTDGDGAYVLNDLPAGSYTISASADGYGALITQSTTVPPDQNNIDFVLCPAGRWRGEYYENRQFSGAPTVRCDDNIDFYWGTGSPMDAIPAADFSVRWSQDLVMPEAACYRFRTFAAGRMDVYLHVGPVASATVDRLPFGELSSVQCLPAGATYTTVDYVSPPEGNKAMAHLTWYRCANGRADCELDITPQYQTQYNDPMPTGCETQTVADVGCLITSYAMALQQLGVNTTPQELNRWLSESQHYGYPGGACDGNLASADFISDFVNEKTNGRIPDLNWVPVNSLDAAKSAIRAGHAVVMHKSSNVDGHWFLAVDVANVGGIETLGINDPMHAVRSVYRGTLDHRTTLRDDGYATAAFKYYIEPKSPATPSLQFLARGTEILITDGLGRRTGYDAASGQVRLEIPNSFYDDASIVPPGGQGATDVERALFLADATQGNYALQFTGTSTAAAAETASVAPGLAVSVVGFDSQYNVVDSVFVGAVEPDTSGVATVTFDPGQQITIVPGTGNSISGRVRDETGSAVGRALVTVYGPVSLSTTTASDGRYLLLNLPAGTYSVAVSKAGYASSPFVVRVVPPSAADADFVLQSQAPRLFLPVALKRR